MKKTLAIVLTLVILASLAIPALAVEPRSFICPRCGATTYEDYEGSTFYRYSTQTNCSKGISQAHSQYDTWCYLRAICDECGTDFIVGEMRKSSQCLGLLSMA